MGLGKQGIHEDCGEEGYTNYGYTITEGAANVAAPDEKKDLGLLTTRVDNQEVIPGFDTKGKGINGAANITAPEEKKDLGLLEIRVDDLEALPGFDTKGKEINGAANNAEDDDEDKKEDEAKEEVDDPWAVLDEASAFKPWNEASTKEKILRVIFYCIAPIIVLGMLYFFICSLDMLTSAFKLLAGRAAGAALTFNEVLSNPICGLMIGVLVTVLVQSSSTSTSIVVAMVASGVLHVKPAIPIVMGANVGTTVTNLLVALTQSVDRTVFRRAFAGATVHDIFNWSTVIILLPLEAITGFLYYMTHAMTKNIGSEASGDNPDFLKAITKPLTSLIVQLDSSVITAIAEELPKAKYPMIKSFCKMTTQDFTEIWAGGNDTVTGECIKDEDRLAILDNRPYAVDFQYNCSDGRNFTVFTYNDIVENNSTKCSHLFVDQGIPGAALSELEAGIILFICSIASLITCLLILVKVLNTVLKGPMAKVVRGVINADFPGYASCLTGYMAMLVGAGVTVLVQSSSVTTAVLTPLVGMGLIKVERIFPLVLGANLGTTVTGILAAMTADADKIGATLQIALCHLFFNITGIMIWYPIPQMRKFPVYLAKQLGIITSQYRWFAVAYVFFFFFLLPITIFGLSLAGIWVLVGVGVPLVCLVIFIVAVNLLQSKRPQCLPTCLRSWDCLPLCCRSLDPMDRCVTVVCANSYCRKCCSCFFKNDEAGEQDQRTDTAAPKYEDIVLSEDGAVAGKVIQGQFEAFECHL